MGYKAKNFAFTHLAGSLAADGLTFTVNTGTGSRFPTLVEGDFTIVALESAAYRELLKVVGISGDTFTIAADGRGYESTTPRAWVAGTVVRCCLTAGMTAHVLATGSRLDDHEAAANPHPQYVTSEEVVAAVAPVQNTANGALQKSGGTMSGPLTLSGDATDNLHAVPKQQLTAAIAALTALPVGMIFPYSGTTAPAGALALPTTPTNISRTTYAKLFAAIGTTWGAGDGSTTFGMPYLPADQVPVQANGNVATATSGDVKSHQHYADGITGSAGVASGTYINVAWVAGYTYSTGGSNNLPAGVRVLYCVQYQ